MTVNVIMFGVAQEIFGKQISKVETELGDRVIDLKRALEKQNPALKELGSYMIAVNNGYAADDLIIQERDEIAVIPPVSGG